MPNLKSSLLLSVLALIPGTIWRYACIALAFVSLVLFIARHQGPARKFNMLESLIKVTEETLHRAKAMPTSASSHAEIINAEGHFLQVKLFASKIQTRMLEMRDETRKVYFKGLKALLLAIRHSAAEVQEIQTALLLTIEEENQRKLTEGIKESREVLSTVVRSPTRRTYLATRRSEPGVGNVRGSYRQCIFCVYRSGDWWKPWNKLKIWTVFLPPSYRQVGKIAARPLEPYRGFRPVRKNGRRMAPNPIWKPYASYFGGGAIRMRTAKMP
ncbi:hypothetical protein DFH06DRAFT_1394301 [Mycena polygramma]|nr:hypothetical protein DFH06DRAFT_1394301 [Mycena polygramma]